MHHRTTAFLWNTLIRGYSIAGVGGGLEVYNQMGREVHGSVVKLGFESDVFVGNTLLSFYGNCGGLRDAGRVFDEMPEKDLVSWNTMIGVFSVNGCWAEVLDLFGEMRLRSGLRPNVVSVVSVLPVCAGVEDEVTASEIHGYVVKVGLEFQVIVGNALLDVYGKCGNVAALKQVLEKWSRRTCFLPVLVELEFFKAGREVHGSSIRMGLESDIFIANSLIDMYAKSGHSTEASNVFYKLDAKNVVSWNAMIANFAQNRFELVAVGLVRQMQDYGELPNSVTFTNVLPACARMGLVRPGKEIHARSIHMGCAFDLFVSNALTDMYAKSGHLKLARNVFDTSLRDEVSYNILIVGHSQTSDCSESLSLFSEMQLMGLKQDNVSFMGALSACANLTAIKQGKEIHGFLLRKLFHIHLFVANSLLDFYTKCGRIGLARNIFDRMTNKDVASWNTMILGYGMLGELDTAIDLFENMRKDDVEYDSVSFIAVLSACSHGGLLEKGRKYFDELKARGIEPTQMHYACMVDLLGRAGLMEEAAELIKGLPIVPDANIWGALLGACRIYGNLELAAWAAEHLFELKPEHSGYYTLLSNMYAETGRWDEANRIRELMKSRGVKKSPGCSWVQIGEQAHAFVVGEKIEGLDLGLWPVESG
ncbi:Pentatricopeptide repeat-containing protein [Vitis vinifera]|uniref:Pentatricopeptide repeat-containing protein n=1 Tax=Vitis vinifera TaxID=29760 RepID=A0A438CVE2_VITVI|nr:Pentatricopeptide repeat-containing protein [Vitis vinifera]